MNISPIRLNINNNNIYTSTSLPKDNKKDIKNNIVSNSYSKVSLDVLNANFSTSFGRTKLVGQAKLTSRKDKTETMAYIKREELGPITSLTLSKGNIDLGYLNLDTHFIFDEDDYILTCSDNNIPKVSTMCSIKGEEYAGIGTALINAAVRESIRKGKNGYLFLVSKKGHGGEKTQYRKNQNPIPFYYKLGFVSPDYKIDKQIKYCLENSKYNLLPDCTNLILSPEAIKSEEHSKYYSEDILNKIK